MREVVDKTNQEMQNNGERVHMIDRRRKKKQPSHLFEESSAICIAPSKKPTIFNLEDNVHKVALTRRSRPAYFRR